MIFLRADKALTREVVFNERLHAFARHWGFTPKACAPYRARTKGKDENGVGYVKANGLAGHRFASWEALEAHLAWWQREVAEVRPWFDDPGPAVRTLAVDDRVVDEPRRVRR